MIHSISEMTEESGGGGGGKSVADEHLKGTRVAELGAKGFSSLWRPSSA